VRKIRYAAVTLASLLLGPATAAYASGGTSVGGYGGTEGVVQSQVAGATASGGLPFTGMNLGLIVAAGVLLIVIGLLLRRQRAHAS
jgi:hypothetical protein